MRLAKLDAKGFLIGATDVDAMPQGGVDAGDLPADGSYRWFADRGCFLPRGFGQGKPSRPDTNRDDAIYLALRALIDGKPIPKEVGDWCDWYKKNRGDKIGRRSR